ncbi:MAG: hypothetical protein J1F39_06220 [Clostridiales bacterium]|nr:hypothetical protein [Clostridiales bacterium]
MKYINKEYGFAFRPPFFDKFFEQTDNGPEISDENYPQKYIVGAGYDYGAPNGVMLVGKHGSMWGVRVLYYAGNRWVDSADLMGKMDSSSANTADGSYAHFSSGPLSIRFVKLNESSMLIKVSTRKKMRVRIMFYPCYDCPGELSIEGAEVSGRSPYIAIVPGTLELTDNNAVYRGRYLVIDEANREYFRAVSYSPPSNSANGANNEAFMDFVINRRQPSVYFYATVGGSYIFNSELPHIETVEGLIDANEFSYAKNKTTGSGELGGPVERMINAMLWSRVYYPYFMTDMYSPKRSALDNNFDIDGTEENCSAILGCYAGVEKAVKQLNYTLEDKILSVFAVWHNFLHMTDRSEMLLYYKKLSALYPPIAVPVIAEKNKLEIAYKWSDSPLKEKHNPASMYSLDLSSLKLLAFDILERIASLFGLAERKKYAKAKVEMIRAINTTFWNEEEGIYMNRYTMGQWATSVGATSFYPLIAGAVDSRERLSLIVNKLTDPKYFWGDCVIPTISMDNKEFGKRSKPDNNGKRTPPYLEYRGSIVPYVNFIVYHGLKRYGLDELAAVVAQKSASLWAANESDNFESYSMYLPKLRRAHNEKYLSANGNMLALIGLQDLIDIEYFRPDLKSAITFGTFASGNNTLTNYRLLDHTYSIEVNDDGTALDMDDKNIFIGDGGKFVVRNFILDNKGGGEFMIDAKANITINMALPSADRTTINYFFIAPAGKSIVKAADGMVNIKKI